MVVSVIDGGIATILSIATIGMTDMIVVVVFTGSVVITAIMVNIDIIVIIIIIRVIIFLTDSDPTNVIVYCCYCRHHVD